MKDTKKQFFNVFGFGKKEDKYKEPVNN